MSIRKMAWSRKILFGGGLLSAVILAAYLWACVPEAEPPGWEKVEPRLTHFDVAADQAARQRVAQVRRYLADREPGAEVFASDVLSWNGKWELLKDVAGYGNHPRFLAETFDRDVVSTADLKAVVAAAVTGYLSDLDGLENDLLIQLRADLADSDLGRGKLRSHLESDAAFRREYWRLSATLLPLLAKDLHFTASREVLALIVMDIGTQVTLEVGVGIAAELGLDVGILSSGVVSGVATLGIGLVVGLVVDAVLDWVLEQLGHDPKAEIARHVRASLKQLGNRLIDGEEVPQRVYSKLDQLARDDWDSAVRAACGQAMRHIEQSGRLGLRWELHRIQEIRGRLREEALRKLLSEGGDR